MLPSLPASLPNCARSARCGFDACVRARCCDAAQVEERGVLEVRITGEDGRERSVRELKFVRARSIVYYSIVF